MNIFSNRCWMTWMILTSILLLPACRKLISVPPSGSEISAGDLYASDEGAEKVILGIYSSIMSVSNQKNMLNGGMSLFAGLSADELVRTSPSLVENAFYGYTLTSQNVSCNTLYTIGYRIIFQCNDALEKLPAARALSDSARSELFGEALFIRGLVYFYLVNLFGDLPLAVSTDYNKNDLLPRTSADTIYQQIIRDLLLAKQLLPDGYIDHGLSPGQRIRPNKAAASALLARVYLYRTAWAQAAQEATSVIGNTSYHLETNLGKIFLASSKEAIWELQPVQESVNTAEGAMFIPASPTIPPTYALTKWLLNSFERGDRRLTNWTGTYNGTPQWVYPYKYKAANTSSQRVEYNTVFRLAEQYLIRAEARVHMGDMTGAAADVSMIRRRAGLSAAMVTDSSNMQAVIRHERQIEFFAEWGHRWLDLKRTGHADPILKAEKPGWNPQAVLYPIPYTDLTRDPNLVQNTGY